MAPEQASADPNTDHRADIYSWGVVAYELLCGQPPFAGRTPQGMLAAHVTEIPEEVTRRRPAIPAGLAALVMRCLEKRPADRPQTADELLHILDSLSTPGSGSLPAGLQSRAMRRRSTGMLVGLGLVIVLGVSAAVLLSRRSATAAAAVPESIAVLPFVRVGGDSTQDYLVDGITDEVSSALANMGL